jgi:hypothetical protein
MGVPIDQATHLNVAAPLSIETVVANAESSEEEPLSQDIAPESVPLPEVPEESARKAEKFSEVQELDRTEESADVQKAALGFPFTSPKPVADDCKDYRDRIHCYPPGLLGTISLDEEDDTEEKLAKSVVTSPVLAQGQEEQANEKAESKLGMSFCYHTRLELNLRKAPPIVEREFLVASTVENHAETAEVDMETEDSDFKTDADTAVETPKLVKPARSLPPHMRPDFQSQPSRHFGLQDSRVIRCIDTQLD